MLDRTAPLTTDDVKDAWKTNEQTVKLFAFDYGSGVEKTFYSVDGGAFLEGTKIAVTGFGSHTIKYYSVGRAGNKE